MKCRKLTAQDAAAYRELRLIALEESAEAFSADAEEAKQKPLSATIEQLEQTHSATFGAFHGDRLLGVMTLVRMMSKKIRHRAEIVAVFTDKAARGKGIATELLDELLVFAKEWDGVHQLELAVNADNTAAIRLYEKMGFERTGILPQAIQLNGRFYDELLMLRILNEDK